MTLALDGVGDQHYAPFIYPGRAPVPILYEVGWAPRPLWKGEENLAPTGVPSPVRPVGSESLYRLRYPDPITNIYKKRQLAL